MTYCRFGEAGQFGWVVTAGLYGNSWECGFTRTGNNSSWGTCSGHRGRYSERITLGALGVGGFRDNLV